MAMYNPPHPGEVIREEILKQLGLSVTEAATLRRKPQNTF